MNKAILVGRLTRDPEVKYTTGENATAVARFSLAVNRNFKNAAGEYEADFINCVAFGKTAEFIEKYFNKGMAMGIVGRIQTRNYTNNDGQKVYVTEVVVEETEFVESKNKGTSDNNTTNNVTKNKETTQFETAENSDDGDFPF